MKKLLLSLLLMALTAVGAQAYDFVVDGIYYNKNGTKATVTYRSTYDSYRGDIIIPETVTYRGTTYTVTTIGNSAFSFCSKLTRVTIPNTVTTICDEAFINCDGLESVTIPNSITFINDYVFYGCKKLSSVVIPESVTSIGECAFSNCNSLTNVVLPSSVSTIKSDAFAICGQMDIHITDLKSWCSIFFENDFSNPLINEGHLFLNGEEIIDLVIPTSVTSIGQYAFTGYHDLKSVTIPNSVTSIGEFAFEECNGLTGVNITDLQAWCNISFRNDRSNPLYYAAHFYLNGDEIIDLIIPETVTSIGEYAFSYFRGLASVTIPNSVTSIGGNAFLCCTGLTSISIGNSVSYIGNYAFSTYSKLERVVCHSMVPPTISRYNFMEAAYNATLYVPFEAQEEYITHENWGKFTHIVPFIGAGPGDVDGDGQLGIADVTVLVDLLLNGDEKPAVADVDGNGTVGIADVTALIDLLLSGDN